MATANSNSNWVAEQDLDVEFAHAMAPDAAIDLFQMPYSTNNQTLTTDLCAGVVDAADYTPVSSFR